MTEAGSTPNQVLVWNRFLLRLLRMPGAQSTTIDPTRSFATMHLAMADAVGAVSGRFTPYRFRGQVSRYASQRAAAASAAYEVLVALYPTLKSNLDTQLARSLLTVRSGSGKTDGIAIGSDSAQAALRPHREAFVLRCPDQFRPEPPPAPTSDEYANAGAEVMSIGADDSLTRTPDQTDIARFWSAPIHNYWNEAAHSASLAYHDSIADDARVFALLNLTFADGTVALGDAKDAYRLQRPIIAIRDLGHPATAFWAPLLATPSDPSYPSAHSVISSAAASILAREFGDRFEFGFTSVDAPGGFRPYATFSAAAQEAGLSRIYAGQNFRFDHAAGQRLGRKVAEHVVARCYYAA